MESASFRVGMVKSKHLIFEIFTYCHFFQASVEILANTSKALRRMIIQNYFYSLNTLIPEKLENLSLDMIKIPGFEFSRFKCYNLLFHTVEQLELILSHIFDNSAFIPALRALNYNVIGFLNPEKSNPLNLEVMTLKRFNIHSLSAKGLYKNLSIKNIPSSVQKIEINAYDIDQQSVMLQGT